jgi:hypothetical protein
MVKMIRMTTQDPNGFYNNEFHSDIVIEPNSRIALHSMTAEINTESITISAGVNDNIQFKMTDSDAVFRSLHITPGTYNSSNYTTLFSDITTKMNKLMFFNNNEIGRQWRAGVNTDKKVVFENVLGEYIKPPVSTETNNKVAYVKAETATQTGNNRVSRRLTGQGTVGNPDSFLYIKAPQCKGSAQLRAKIINTTNNNTENVILGYTTTPPDTTTTSIDLSTIKYGIKCNSSTNTYSYYLNGVLNLSTRVQQTNDVISIDTYQNSLFLTVYKDDGNIIESIPLQSFPYNHTDNLFPVIIFLGANTNGISNIQFSSDPFYTTFNEIVEPIELIGFVPVSSSNPTIKTLQFMDTDLASFFGYKQTFYQSTRGVSYAFVAENFFQPADFSDSFILELLNLNVDSYDGLSKERRNFLHCIVQADIIRNRLTYTAPFLLWLDIKNSNKLALRNIKMRLLKEDGSPVNLMGISQVTIVIE